MFGLGGSPANPTPPCTARELLLKSVTLSRTALQLLMRASNGLSFAKSPSSGMVLRGPSLKIHVTRSDKPSGWHEAQLLQPSADCFPRKLMGTKSRMGVPNKPLSGVPSAVKNVNLPTRTA